MIRAVKTAENIAAGATGTCVIWEDGQATPKTLEAEWGWTSSGNVLLADTEAWAARAWGHEQWFIVGADCDGIAQAPGAPLGDPPTALGIVYLNQSAGDVVLDGESSYPGSGETIDTFQWAYQLSGSNYLLISGPNGGPPTSVTDSRSILDNTDIGTNINGNTELLEIDETAGSLSAPYTVSLIAFQSDTQTGFDNAGHTLTFAGGTEKIDCGANSSIANIWDAKGAVRVRFKPATGSATNDVILRKRDGWHLVLRSVSGSTAKVRINVDFSTTDGVWETTNSDITLDAWNDILVNYDADSTSVNPEIYINGTSVAVSEISTPDGTRVSDSANTLYFGSNNGASTMTGELDFVAFYSDYIPADDVLDPSPTNLIEHWAIDEGTGTNAAAAVTSPTNDGTITGATWS